MHPIQPIIYTRSRIIVHNRHHSILQTHSIRIRLPNPGILIQPAQHLLMPDEAILRLGDPTQLARLCYDKGRHTNGSHRGSSRTDWARRAPGAH